MKKTLYVLISLLLTVGIVKADTLWEFYHGKLPSIAERALIYEGEDVYTGTAKQNAELLKQLQTPILGLAVLTVPQGGTGASTLSGCLEGNGTGAITGTGSACGTGSGTGSGFSTTSADYWGAKGEWIAGKFTATSTATSTFSGGLYANLISAPYFHATSTTATSTFSGGILSTNASGYFGVGKNLTLPKTASTTLSTLQDFFHLYSAGKFEGGTISDIGGGAVSVSSGSGTIAVGPLATDDLVFSDWEASTTITIPTNTVRWIGVEYNAGVPRITSLTSDTFTYQDSFPLGIVKNENGTIHVTNNPRSIADSPGLLLRRFHQTRPFERDTLAGGIILGETGTRNITLSGGYLWDRNNRFTIDAFDSSGADRFDMYYGATKYMTSQSQWDNLSYNNGGTMASTTANRWSNLWFYVESDGDILGLYGTSNATTQATAETETAPATLPLRCTENCTLVGRLTFQKSASTGSIASAFVTTFTSGAASTHSNLSNLEWTVSGHSGTANTIPYFSSTGASAVNAALEWTASALVVGNTATSTFSSGLEVGTKIAAPYFNATGTAATSTLAGGLIVDTNSLVVDYSSGKVGIGTSTPTRKLTVWSSGSNGIGIGINTFEVAKFVADSGTGEISIGSSLANYYPVFYSNNAEAMRITTTGLVGIGTTSPSAKLSINQSSTGSGFYLAGYSNNTSALFRVSTSTLLATSTAFIINSNGRVGVGTTSPEADLTVNGTAVFMNNITTYATTSTSTIAGGFSVGGGATEYDFSSGVTSIDNLQQGLTSFDSDAGIVTWIDLPVSSSAVSGTQESYTASIAGDSILTVSAQSNGVGGILNTFRGVGIGTTSPLAMFDVVMGSTTLSSTGFTAAYNGVNFNNLATSSTASIIKSALNIQSSGAWTGVNVGLNITSTTGGGSNFDALFNGGGFVGIGTTSPYAALSVVGSTGIVAEKITATSTTATSTISGGLIVTGSLTATLDKSTVLASSTLAYLGSYGAAGTTTILIANPSKAMTLVNFYCKTDTGTAYVGFGDGAATTTEANCSSSGVLVTPATNNTWTERENMFIEVGTITGTPNKITITRSER